ncbi:XdhC family protein [Nostoc sp. CHAB 5824]|nr:XdhC family protein [Nostoc sp. CHAB 5824]
MLNFYQQLAKTLKQDAVVLATVTSTKGSTPREVGAKMFVSADGKIFGTIGGGAGEAKVYQQALQVLQTGKKQFVEIDLSGAPQRETQGICVKTRRNRS